MIPDIQFSVFCEDVRREASGNFQFLGVFADNVVVRQLPVRFMKFCIANRWNCGQGTFKQKTVVMCPDGHTPLVNGQEIEIRVQDGSRSYTSVETFLGVEFRETGTYWIEVSLDGDLRMRYPFTVRIATPPPPPKS